MRKLLIGLGVVASMALAGSFAWAGSATIPAPLHYSPVQKAACGGPGPRCPWGSRWVCGPYRCGCAPCGAGYWYRPWRY